MALVQSLVIVAALAAVSLALIQRAGQGQARLEARFAADQIGLYLDAGVDLLRGALPRGLVHQRQDWAIPRAGVAIDRGTLSWQVEDLSGRFNLAWLADDPSGVRTQALDRLAAAQGLSAEGRARLVDAVATLPEPAPVAVVLWRQTVQGLIDAGQVAQTEGDALDRLMPSLTMLPDAPVANVNTLLPEVLAALAPDLSERHRHALLDQAARTPFADSDALTVWAQATLGDQGPARLAALPLGVTSRHFLARIEARLDTQVLRRTVVLDTGAAAGRARVLMSVPEAE